MKTVFDPCHEWFPKGTVKLDLGFFGAQKDYGFMMDLPHKKPRRSRQRPTPTLSDAQKMANREHAKARVLVEHAIGGMKSFFCLTHRIRNQSMAIIDPLFELSAGLWNMKIA